MPINTISIFYINNKTEVGLELVSHSVEPKETSVWKIAPPPFIPQGTIETCIAFGMTEAISYSGEFEYKLAIGTPETLMKESFTIAVKDGIPVGTWEPIITPSGSYQIGLTPINIMGNSVAVELTFSKLS